MQRHLVSQVVEQVFIVDAHDVRTTVDTARLRGATTFDIIAAVLA